MGCAVTRSRIADNVPVPTDKVTVCERCGRACMASGFIEHQANFRGCIRTWLARRRVGVDLSQVIFVNGYGELQVNQRWAYILSEMLPPRIVPAALDSVLAQGEDGFRAVVAVYELTRDQGASSKALLEMFKDLYPENLR